MTPPVEVTKNPLLQTVRRCLLQKKLPKRSSSCDADFDFSLPMISDGAIVGGVSSRKWTWSSSPLISTTEQLLSMASERIVSYRKSRFLEVNI